MSKDLITARIAKEGYPFIFIGTMLSCLGFYYGSTQPAVAMVILTLFTIWFFRNPHRDIPGDKHIIASPADGKIICIEQVEEQRFLNKEVIKISVFMSVFNVHVNRIPIAGVIKDIFYNKGKYISAFKEKASLENEQNAILMETTSGHKILFVQIAGLIARRIVCYVKPGDKVSPGDRFGLIRFGSRVDIYLPTGVCVNVNKGDTVTAGETVLARFL